MSRLRNSLIALDQLIGAVLLGSYPDETISAYAYRTRTAWLSGAINWIFQDPAHCKASYESEMQGKQNAPEYRP